MYGKRFSIGDQVTFKLADGSTTFGKVNNISGPSPHGQYIHQVQVGDYTTGTTHMIMGEELAIVQPLPLSVAYAFGAYPTFRRAGDSIEIKIDPPRAMKCDCGLHAVDASRMVGHSRGCPFEHYGAKGFNDNF